MKWTIGIKGPSALRDKLVDEACEAASAEIGKLTNRRFIPKTEAINYDYPQRNALRSYVIVLDEDLLTVTKVTSDNGAATIALADIFLEPSRFGKPYQQIQIDLGSTAYFLAQDTFQRAIVITGTWGYGDDVGAAGALAAAIIDGTDTTLDCDDAAAIDVGQALLIDTEQLFVTARAAISSTTTLNGALTADHSNDTVAVADGTKVKLGEVILVDSERMLVEDIVSNDLTVTRAWDGTTLATHANAATVNVYRRLSVDRGVNGTTAAAHSSGATIEKYLPPADIRNLALGLAVAYYHQQQASWTGEMGSGEHTIETKMVGLGDLRERVRRLYRRVVIGAA